MTVELSEVALWASIVSPLIAVIIALWSGISSRKATAKQLAAIEESTAMQVKSMSIITKTLHTIASIQLECEAKDVEYRLNRIQSDSNSALERQSSFLGTQLNSAPEYYNREREKEDERISESTYLMKKQIILSTSLDKLKALEIFLNKE